MVTMNAPAHITIKTVVNTWDVCFVGAFEDSINARDKQMKSGPLINNDEIYFRHRNYFWTIANE
jgi:hypothetical protein